MGSEASMVDHHRVEKVLGRNGHQKQRPPPRPLSATKPKDDSVMLFCCINAIGIDLLDFCTLGYQSQGRTAQEINRQFTVASKGMWKHPVCSVYRFYVPTFTTVTNYRFLQKNNNRLTWKYRKEKNPVQFGVRLLLHHIQHSQWYCFGQLG